MVVEVKVYMQYGDRFWSNVWEVESPDLATVIANTGPFITFHRDLLLDVYSVARILIREAGTTDAFSQLIVNESGNMDATGSKLLPLYDTVGLVLSGSFLGRTGLKYLRGLLVDGSIDTNGLIVDGVKALVLGALGTLSGDLAAEGIDIILEAGKVVTDGSIRPLPQMRQLHRKRKKTVTP